MIWRIALAAWLTLLLAVVGQQSRAQFNGCSAGFCSRVAATPAGGCSQATAFLARTSGLDGTHTTAYTNLVCCQVVAGTYSIKDVQYIFATQTAGNALLDLTPNANNATVVGAPTFTADSGYIGITGANFLQTPFNAATAGSPNFTQNSAHMSVWNLTNLNFSLPVIGTDLTETQLYPQFTDGNFYSRLNDAASSAGTAVADPRGLLLGNRSSSTALQHYRNGSSIGAPTQASQPATNAAFAILQVPGAGTDSVHQIAAASIGGSMTPTQVAADYSCLRSYMTAVGVP